LEPLSPFLDPWVQRFGYDRVPSARFDPVQLIVGALET
jgi:hypothetical protein